MAAYRNALPQLAGDIFLTDGGLETDLIFHEGLELPDFAAFVLLRQSDGYEALRTYFRRYAFRTAPLRNVALQPTFMHNGAYTSLEAAIRHHLDVAAALRGYDPAAQGLDVDLAGPTGPWQPLLARLDPRLDQPLVLTNEEFEQLVAFVGEGLLDERARPERLGRLIPKALPSDRPPLVFEFPKREPPRTMREASGLERGTGARGVRRRFLHPEVALDHHVVQPGLLAALSHDRCLGASRQPQPSRWGSASRRRVTRRGAVRGRFPLDAGRAR